MAFTAKGPARSSTRPEATTGEEHNEEWIAMMVKSLADVPAMFNNIYRLARQVAIKAERHHVDQIYLVGSSGSHNNNQMALRFMQEFGFKLPIYTISAEELIDTNCKNILRRKTAFIFSSRSGTTPSICKAAQRVEDEKCDAFTIAFTDPGATLLPKHCAHTIGVIGPKHTALAIGSTVVCLAILPFMAGFLTEFNDWDRADELLELLQWACSSIPSLKERHRKKTHEFANEVLAQKPSYSFFAGNCFSLPLVEQAAWCWASELSGHTFIPLDYARVMMGPCEVMDENTIIIRLEDNTETFVGRNYEMVHKTIKFRDLVVPKPDMSNVLGGSDLKNFVGVYVHIAVLYNVVEFITAHNAGPTYSTKYYHHFLKVAK